MNAPPTISAPPPAPDLGGWLHDLSPFAFRISGDFGVRWYGLAYIAGFIVAYALLRMLARRRHLRVATPACPRLRAPQRPAAANPPPPIVGSTLPAGVRPAAR